MRARYYNSQIKRFINQDVLTGSITSSPTLNRYSYVEGNPINLTDPFGLSPSCGKSDFGHGMLNLLGMIPGFGEGFDIANAIWYFKEGNLTEGFLSLASGLPIVGSVAVGGVKLFKGGKKALDTAEKFHKACRLISNGATFTRAGSGFIKTGDEIYKEYIKNGKPLDGNFALKAGSMVLNGVTMFFSGKGFVKDFKTTKLANKMKNAAKKAVDSAKAGFKKFISDETGSIKNPFAKKSNVNTNVYYQVTSKSNASKIIETGELYGKEFKQVYAWKKQPTYNQAANSGARDIETVIRFETNASFSYDTSMDDISLHKIAVISDRPAPISVNNVVEVGFKSQRKWWQFWKKF